MGNICGLCLYWKRNCGNGALPEFLSQSSAMQRHETLLMRYYGACSKRDESHSEVFGCQFFKPDDSELTRAPYLCHHLPEIGQEFND